MDIFEEMQKYGHEELNFFYENEFDLRAIVTIHNSNPGMAFGITRAGNYAFEECAITDALKLSRNATLSAAITNCDLGGAAGVLVNDDQEKNEGYLRAYGRFLQSLGSRLCTMTEAGLKPQDMIPVSKEFPNIVGLPEFCSGAGEAHSYIAQGALLGIKACVNELFGNPSLEKKTVLVYGLSPAAIELVKFLSKEGAIITVTDRQYDNVKKMKDEISNIRIIRPNEWETVDTDIFSLCENGTMITRDYIEKKKCKIIAGLAKLPLESDDLAELARSLGIIYAPDFVMNASESIFAYSEVFGFDEAHLKHHINQVYDIMAEILVKSKDFQTATDRVAEELGLNRLNIVHKLRKIYTGAF